MKIRAGFISNSSTSSFVCDIKDKALVDSKMRKIIEFWNEISGCTYALDCYTIFKVDKEYIKKINDEWEFPDKLFKDDLGKIVIEGKQDNSMPYQTFEIIENVFNAHRYHLG